MAKRNMRASELVEAAGKRRNWFDSLNSNDRKYVRDVVKAMQNHPGAPIYAVALRLKEELKLTPTRDNVAMKLKELIRNG